MLCTDVLSRGIDVDNIDWVVQFDVPKQTSWFVHRGGRSARCGKEGNNLLLLTPAETAYVKFIQNYEKVLLTELASTSTDDGSAAEEIRLKIVDLASKERELLESGTRAYMSFIESYVRHDCNVVCSPKELDVVGYGHAYGLLRLPRMKELAHKDLSSFRRSDIDTAKIPYKKVEREKRRQQKLLLREEENKLAKETAEKKFPEKETRIVQKDSKQNSMKTFPKKPGAGKNSGGNPLKMNTKMDSKAAGNDSTQRDLLRNFPKKNWKMKEGAKGPWKKPRKRPHPGEKDQPAFMKSDVALLKTFKKRRLKKKEFKQILAEGLI